MWSVKDGNQETKWERCKISWKDFLQSKEWLTWQINQSKTRDKGAKTGWRIEQAERGKYDSERENQLVLAM